MWSVNSWPNPGDRSIASRSASGTGCPEGRISNSIMVRNFLGRMDQGPDGLAGYSLGDVVADFDGGAAGPGALALDQVLGDRLLDPGGLGGQAQVVAEHGGGQDSRRRVGLALARDVGRAAVDRLEHAGRGALRVDVAAGGQPDPARHGGAQVGEDVAEQVVGDDDVEPLG